MYIFDAIRNQHPDWYTQHPIAAMDNAHRQALAERLGVSVDELLKQALTPGFEMTCPLCGWPQTHLSDCKGCGTGAFSNWEFEEAYGLEARTQIRSALEDVLIVHAGELGSYAAGNAYDCMVCADCWREAVRPGGTYQFCPLRLLADRTLKGNIVAGLLYLGLDGGPAAMMRVLQTGIDAWLTDADRAAWRQPIYAAALAESEVDREKPDTAEQVREIEVYLGLPGSEAEVRDENGR